MIKKKAVVGVCLTLLLGICGCSRQQSDWEKTRAANTTDSYEQFLKKYPNGEFAAQAQARVKELYEEHDWQKARDADTQEAYQAFLKQYPEGKWTEEARIRVENFTLAQAPSNACRCGSRQYPRQSCAGRCCRQRSRRRRSRLPAGGSVEGTPCCGAGQDRETRRLLGVLRDTTRRVQIERGRRQQALVAFGEGISEAPRGTLADGVAEKSGLRHPVPFAGVGTHGKTSAHDLQGIEGQIPGLRCDPSGASLSNPHRAVRVSRAVRVRCDNSCQPESRRGLVTS